VFTRKGKDVDSPIFCIFGNFGGFVRQIQVIPTAGNDTCDPQRTCAASQDDSVDEDSISDKVGVGLCLTRSQTVRHQNPAIWQLPKLFRRCNVPKNLEYQFYLNFRSHISVD
jgi:hypothetical protein